MSPMQGPGQHTFGQVWDPGTFWRLASVAGTLEHGRPGIPYPFPEYLGGSLYSYSLSQRSQAGDPEVGGSRVHLEPGLAIPRWDTSTMLRVGRLPRPPDRVTSPCWRYLATLAL